MKYVFLPKNECEWHSFIKFFLSQFTGSKLYLNLSLTQLGPSLFPNIIAKLSPSPSYAGLS